MPKGTTQTRLENIAKENATVTIEELNYDDCVRMAAKEAAETTRGIMVQDTAWEGYEKIPTWIMQGYGTLAMEADKQLEEDGCRPTHIFIQAGVGSLAGGDRLLLQPFQRKSTDHGCCRSKRCRLSLPLCYAG